MSDRGRCSSCAWWLGPRTDQNGVTVGNCSRILTRAETPAGPYVFGEGVGYTHEQGVAWARLAVTPDFGCVRWERR